jgi:hypothetical protein
VIGESAPVKDAIPPAISTLALGAFRTEFAQSRPDRAVIISRRLASVKSTKSIPFKCLAFLARRMHVSPGAFVMC